MKIHLRLKGTQSATSFYYWRYFIMENTRIYFLSLIIVKWNLSLSVSVMAMTSWLPYFGSSTIRQGDWWVRSLEYTNQCCHIFCGNNQQLKLNQGWSTNFTISNVTWMCQRWKKFEKWTFKYARVLVFAVEINIPQKMWVRCLKLSSLSVHWCLPF